jgi:hypothetical protein
MTAPDWIVDFTEPNVCLGENLTNDDAGNLLLAPWSVPRLVADVKGSSGGDGALVAPLTTLPGKLLIDIRAQWRNDAPLDQEVTIRVTRGSKAWVTSNPNAVQFRDRWSYGIGSEPAEPVTSGLFNSQCGSAVDFGTNSVAEPNPGVQWMWHPCNMMDEWVGPLAPGEILKVWYRCYVWTPPPFSDNANKNDPKHAALAGWARVSLLAQPQQGTVVAG